MKRQTYSLDTEDNLIVMKVVGRQNVAAVQDLRNQVEEILQHSDKPYDIMVLSSGVGVADPKVLQASLQALLEVPFRRLAMVGNTPDRINSGSIVVKTAADSERYKIFHHEEDARAWLQNPDS